MKNSLKKSLLCFSCIIALVFGMVSTASATVGFPAIAVTYGGTVRMAVKATSSETKVVMKFKDLKTGTVSTRRTTPGSIFDINLRRNTWFRVCVLGYNRYGNQISKRYVHLCNNPTLDASVSGTRRAGSSTGYLTFKWPAVYKSTGYKVFMSIGDDKHFKCVSTQKGTSYTTYGVPRGKKYYFYVRPYIRLSDGKVTYAPMCDKEIIGWFN